jgi:hypothetical protein
VRPVRLLYSRPARDATPLVLAAYAGHFEASPENGFPDRSDGGALEDLSRNVFKAG